jgi:hypothetical protein
MVCYKKISTYNKQMWKIVVTIILTSIFFILFFEPRINLKNKGEQKFQDEPPSTTKGFIEDTYDPFIIPMYPSRLDVDRGDDKLSKHLYGDIGTFIGYSSVPENHWLHGFPHEKSQ